MHTKARLNPGRDLGGLFLSGGSAVKRRLFCESDTGCAELRYSDGIGIATDREKAEDLTNADMIRHPALDCLIRNKPFECAVLVLCGGSEEYGRMPPGGISGRIMDSQWRSRRGSTK